MKEDFKGWCAYFKKRYVVYEIMSEEALYDLFTHAYASGEQNMENIRNRENR